MKELKIGETLTIRCVEYKGNGSQCNGCAFAGNECDGIPCWRSERKDGKNVHYEIVSDKDIEPMVGAAAKEAIQVTTDKAWEWVRQNLFNPRAGKNTDIWEKDFRKAMTKED